MDDPVKEATVKETSLSLETVYLKTYKDIDVWMSSIDGIELDLFVIEILDKELYDRFIVFGRS